jgi:transcriptional regulator with XRE-family HTH domain
VPWVPVKYALRRMRESRGWTLQDLVDKSRASERQLQTLESRNPPGFVRADTADRISAAFGLRLLEWNSWKADDRWILWVPHTKGDALDAEHLNLPPVGTLPRLAKMERELGLHEQMIETPDGPYEVLGLDRLNKCFTKPKAFEGHKFAVIGRVDQQQSLPSSAARVLDAEPDVGAMFRISRAVAKRLPQYVTVCAVTDEHSDLLMSLHGTPTPVTALVRVAFAPPAGAWRGFFIFEYPPRARKFAYVVERLLINDGY